MLLRRKQNTNTEVRSTATVCAPQIADIQRMTDNWLKLYAPELGDQGSYLLIFETPAACGEVVGFIQGAQLIPLNK